MSANNDDTAESPISVNDVTVETTLNETVETVIKPEAEALLSKPSEENENVGIIPSQDGEPEMTAVSLRVYPKRWLVLFIVALLNNTNTITWISFAPVANFVDDFYHQNGATNWFSMVFMLVTVPVGVVAMWAGRHFGLRVAILLASWSMGIGVVIRLISSFLPESLMFPVGLAGQSIAATAYPFIMFMPTKVAGSWFAANERALATTIGIMANPLGILIANLLGPQLVKEASHVLYLNILITIPSILICILATVFITSSDPKTPPTLSAAQPQMPFLAGIKEAFQNKAFIIILIVMGGGIGMFNCLYVVLQQLLCSHGYENWFSGMCAAAMIIGGVIGATVSGIFVDRTRRYSETVKVSLSLSVVMGLIFLQLSMVPHISPLIIFVCFCFGFLGLAAYPVSLELAAECTFPVTETTSTGLIVIVGQIQSVIFVAIMSQFAKPLSSEDVKIQACGDPAKAKDMSVSILIMSAIAVSLAVVLVIFFKPVYKRMQAESGTAANDTEALAVTSEPQNENNEDAEASA